MTAREVLDKTLKVMGITDNEGNPVISKRVKSKAVTLINLVYGDLFNIVSEDEFEPITSLSDEIDLSEKILNETFLYGLAMHIAFTESDTDSEQYFSILYNKKRTSLNSTAKIINNLPRSVGL